MNSMQTTKMFIVIKEVEMKDMENKTITEKTEFAELYIQRTLKLHLERKR